MSASRVFPILAVILPVFLIALFIACLEPPAARAAHDPGASARQQETGAVRCVNPGGTGGCYPTIQSAVNAANNGDTIRVSQGTYHEAVYITESLILEGGWAPSWGGRDWETYITKIDAHGAGSVIRINGPVSATIDGFVLTGGDGSAFLGWGGGILAQGEWEGDGDILIRHNVITDNVACRGSCQGYGGGIMIYSNRATIEHNTVISNAARAGGDGTGQGGGIAVWGYPVDAVLSQNQVISNTAAISPTGPYARGEGGGLWSEGGADLVGQDNTFRGNVAAIDVEGRGGGIYASGDFYGNQILSNTASISGTGYGGGLYAYYVPNFDGNFVQGNWASRNADGSGGGIYAQYLQNAYDNTIDNNWASRGGGVFYQEYVGHQKFEGNRVTRNWATSLDTGAQDGGGGISSEADWVEIVGNEILTNTALAGGGLRIMAGNKYMLQGNLIMDNWAVAGGGIYVYTATGSINRNWIDGNHAVWWGGGVFLTGKASPVMDANAVTANAAGGNSGFAGGGMMLFLDASTHVTLTNHVIARNTIPSGQIASGVHCLSGSCSLIHCSIVDNLIDSNPGEGVRIGALDGTNYLWNSIIAGHASGVVFGGGATAQLGYNDYFDNTANVSGGTEGVHALHADPHFLDWVGGDYHLSDSSTLINAGDASLSTPRDFDNLPRLLPPDIGAYEFIVSKILLPFIQRDVSPIDH